MFDEVPPPRSTGPFFAPKGITEIGRAAMLVEGEKVPADVLLAEEKAKGHAMPHVNFYDPSVYQVEVYWFCSCLGWLSGRFP